MRKKKYETSGKIKSRTANNKKQKGNTGTARRKKDCRGNWSDCCFDS